MAPESAIALGRWAVAGVALGLLALTAAASAETVSGSGLTTVAACDGDAALVAGSFNNVVFHGACRSLRIVGSSNDVEVELVPGGSIGVAGSGNHVLHAPRAAPPVVEMNGEHNRIEPGSFGAASEALAAALPDAPPAPPTLYTRRPGPLGLSAPALVLDADQQDVEAICAGRDVLIHGSKSHYVLHAGCRSVVVLGRANHIEAELQPGARVVIGGAGVSVDYTLTRDGPDPVISVTGTGSRATLLRR